MFCSLLSKSVLKKSLAVVFAKKVSKDKIRYFYKNIISLCLLTNLYEQFYYYHGFLFYRLKSTHFTTSSLDLLKSCIARIFYFNSTSINIMKTIKRHF